MTLCAWQELQCKEFFQELDEHVLISFPHYEIGLWINNRSRVKHWLLIWDCCLVIYHQITTYCKVCQRHVQMIEFHGKRQIKKNQPKLLATGQPELTKQIFKELDTFEFPERSFSPSRKLLDLLKNWFCTNKEKPTTSK